MRFNLSWCYVCVQWNLKNDRYYILINVLWKSIWNKSDHCCNGISKSITARTYMKKSHFSMSAYSSSYAMFVLLYPLYYLYLTNRNTQSSGIIVEIHKIKKGIKENKKKHLVSKFFPCNLILKRLVLFRSK